jgi:hypothetical protein
MFSDDEKQILAPAIRRACLLTLRWRDNRNIADINYVLREIKTTSDATDVILALLLLHDNDVLGPLTDENLYGLAECAKDKETSG